jgi:iron complex outermembrane receptor protein
MLKPVVLVTVFSLAETSLAQNQLEEIVVTAQKREETLQDAAISVTALAGNEISHFGISNFNDLQSQMPAVQFMGTITTNTTIRGVGTYNNQPNVDAAVSWNIDGTYLSHHMATPPILFDIDRIEVVRGPMGTLYGKNSNGGAINIVTSKPVLGEWHARAEVGVGNYSQVDTEFMLNMPLGETAALRVAVANDYSEGYFEDGTEGTDNYAARARLLWEPTENFDLIATLDWSDVDGTGAGHSYCPPVGQIQSPVGCAGIKWIPYQGMGYPGQFVQNGNKGPVGDSPAFNKRENWGAYLEMNYRWDSATLTSISNWHKYDRSELNVRDFNASYPIHSNDFVSEELRIANAPDSNFDWVIGTYFSSEDSDGLEQTVTFTNPGLVITPLSSYGVENGKVTSAAIFSEVTYPITEKARLKGGLRYTDEEKKLPGTARSRLNTPNPISVATGAVLNTDKLTWLIGAEYDLAEENMLYFKVNTGFKSGNVNPVPPDIGLPTVTTPEEIIAYQVGSKNRFNDNRIEVNAEFFYYDYDGYQTVVVATDPTGFFIGNFFPTANAQKAVFKGGEIESLFLAGDSGQFELTLTLLDAKHKEFVTPTANLSGNDVQRTPDYTVTAGYQHHFQLSNGASLVGRITSQYVDGHYTRDENRPGDYQDSYTNTSAYLNYQQPQSRWNISAWVRNLEDEPVMGVSQSGAGRGGWNVFMLPPRMYGVTFKYEM